MEVRYPPHKRGISAILARYPMQTRQKSAIPPSAILSRKGIASIWGGISHWAAKGEMGLGESAHVGTALSLEALMEALAFVRHPGRQQQSPDWCLLGQALIC